MKEIHSKAKQDKLSLTASRALVTNANGNVAVSAVTSTELGYLDGVTSAVQTQLNGKAASSDLTNHISAYNNHLTSFNTHTSDTTKHITAAERTAWNAKQAAISGTANAVMITDANGKPTVSSVITVSELNKLNGLTPTTTELNYLDGATSNIQDQINAITAGGFMPDYSSPTSLSTGSTIVSINAIGYVRSVHDNSVHLSVTVDGCEVFYVQPGTSSSSSMGAQFFIPAGSTVTIEGSLKTGYYVPLKAN